MMIKKHIGTCLLVLLSFCPSLWAQKGEVKLLEAGEGWARNSVNSVIFRKNSLVSHKGYQYIAYYDDEGFVVLGKRPLKKGQWVWKQTEYKGNVRDAHNSISIMVDGHGYLHLSWDHHGGPLNYSRSKMPGSLEMGPKMQMTGVNEGQVTYPEFYRMPDGGLLFLYRNGRSGSGNLVINTYDLKSRQWTTLHENLIDGEGQRNGYAQSVVDGLGNIHVSWVWRESPNVATNHDMCYARSRDGGLTWEKSNGEKYVLPITAASAEYIINIPQNSELINQTSMDADRDGNPIIASYWKEQGSDIPQYHLIYQDGEAWRIQQLDFRKEPFSLSGVGTKSIPISRPQVLLRGQGKKRTAYLLFRDSERRNKVSAVVVPRLGKEHYEVIDLSDLEVGDWEPSYDTELWKGKKNIHLYVQKVTQADLEGQSDTAPQKVYVLEWRPY